MIRILQRYVPFVLALTVALSSVTHIQARHSAYGAQSMVICTGYGLVRITLDANGDPVELSLPCPDCVITPAAILAGAPFLEAPDSACAASPVAGQALWAGSAAGLWCESRGPPELA
jgi:hypothetical protein